MDNRGRRYVAPDYRVPRDLFATALRPRRVVVLGSCGAAELLTRGKPDFPWDFVTFNLGGVLGDAPPRPVEAYDFQVLQLALRHLVGDHGFGTIAQNDAAGHAAHFAEACTRLESQIEAQMLWNTRHGLLSFVLNFPVPQQNPNGRLLPRYALSNPVHFVEELNRHLGRTLETYANAYLVDVDGILAGIGRRHVQDDAVLWLAHNTLMPDLPADGSRIEPSGPVEDYYELKVDEAMAAVWNEVDAAFRTVRQVDPVKLVAVDLDDTLWRGVLGDMEEVGPEMVESFGWPFGIVEALCFLRKRGILLAIVSRNDAGRVNAAFPAIMQGRIALSDFACVKVGFRDKMSSMAEILEETNLLPRNVVFLDDNPVERAAMLAAFPGLRTLGADHLHWRRTLLWAAETQVAQVSEESGRRTEMIHAQGLREGERKRLSRAEFLAGLNLRLIACRIARPDHPRFARAFELLNKTNQFNTTGERWDRAGIGRLLAEGGAMHVFSATDTFSDYGLIGVGLTRGAEILQFAMSCRVAGLDVEVAAISVIASALPGTVVTARTRETDANLMSRDLYPRCGFAEAEAGLWRRCSEPAIPVPEHVGLVPDPEASAPAVMARAGWRAILGRR